MVLPRSIREYHSYSLENPQKCWGLACKVVASQSSRLFTASIVMHTKEKNERSEHKAHTCRGEGWGLQEKQVRRIQSSLPFCKKNVNANLMSNTGRACAIT